MECFFNKYKYCFLVVVLLFFCLTRISFSQQLPLTDLKAFKESSNDWQTVGGVVYKPFNKEAFRTVQGTGILVGSASSRSQGSNLKTKMNHGDIVLEFDFLLSRNASAIIWLQGRYGIQLANAWRNETSNYLVSGSLIRAKSGDISSMGNVANMNVAYAPGIWQHIKIAFKAPQFDENKEKTQKAKFVSIEQNGVIIQQNKYLPYPSKNAVSNIEVSKGPIVFSINKGNIAIKNITYMVPSGKKVKLTNLTYKLYLDKFLDGEFFYGKGKDNSISLPDLTSREPNRSGKTNLLNTQMADDIGSPFEFSLVFDGEMHVPESGEYQFKAIPNGVGAFQLDGKELFRWDAINKIGELNDSVYLDKGIYSFKLTYINFQKPQVGIVVNGPGIINQPLYQQPEVNIGDNATPIILRPTDKQPLIQRSFVFHDGQKLLSAINVGYSKGIHYTVNLATGGLVRVWRGEFANVSPMWRGRGMQQVLEPLGSILSLTADRQVFLSNSENLKSVNEQNSGNYRLIGYRLNQNGEPIFKYTVNEIAISDYISLGRKGRTLTRSIRFENTSTMETNQTIWYRIASASNIEQVTKNIYSISDKTYYVELDKNVSARIKQENERQILFVPVKLHGKTGTPQTISYSLIW